MKCPDCRFCIFDHRLGLKNDTDFDWGFFECHFPRLNPKNNKDGACEVGLPRGLSVLPHLGKEKRGGQ